MSSALCPGGRRCHVLGAVSTQAIASHTKVENVSEATVETLLRAGMERAHVCFPGHLCVIVKRNVCLFLFFVFLSDSMLFPGGRVDMVYSLLARTARIIYNLTLQVCSADWFRRNSVLSISFCSYYY